MRSKIEKIATGKSGEVYSKLMESLTYDCPPHAFIGKAYNLYKDTCNTAAQKSRSINGGVFEFLVAETLAQEGITPFYYQARFVFIPDAAFDILLYDETRPVALSMKVSLRERYKQAGAEGKALADVYNQSENILVTLSEKEAPSVAAKIKKSGIKGLDRCVLAHKQEYTDLLNELANRKFSEAAKVLPVKGKIIPV